MGTHATLRFYNPYPQPVRTTLRLDVASFDHQRTLRLSITGQPAGEILVLPTPGVQNIELLLPPGEHILALEAGADADPAQNGALLSLRFFTMSAHFSPPMP
jgi:hypothetical protein